MPMFSQIIYEISLGDIDLKLKKYLEKTKAGAEEKTSCRNDLIPLRCMVPPVPKRFHIWQSKLRDHFIHHRSFLVSK
jgi:hypothetical protein